MSLKAIIWVMEEAPVESHTELVVLYALADRASDDGTAAWPSQDWIAHRARCSTRTVRRSLTSMEKRGVIRRGNQALTSHLGSGRRPTVWDLNMDAKRTNQVSGHPVRPTKADTGDTQSGHTGQPKRTERVTKVDTAMSYEPSLTTHEPSKNHRGARKEKTQPSERGTRLPENWQPPIETNNNLGKKYPHVDLDEELEIFRDYWAAKTGKDAVKRDWVATWRNWVRRTSKWGSAQSGKTTQAENEEIWSIEI